MHRTQIYLEERQYQLIKEKAYERNISIAEFIRNLIDNSLFEQKNYNENSLFNIGDDNFTMKRKKGSIQHDEYIYRRKN